MNNDIISLFPEAVPKERWKKNHPPEHYLYYQLPDGSQMALPIQSLSVREQRLLEAMLTPISPGIEEASPWADYLQERSDKLPERIPDPFRFLFLEAPACIFGETIFMIHFSNITSALSSISN
ncbi:hypothetical protein ACFOLK_17345 [Marinococcus halophilus]|uniref:hypothetical protein n=1 Tax=Marinococcus halophilus TaxID=1371 RepID=UPI00361711FE